jgi:hypothetical protein
MYHLYRNGSKTASVATNNNYCPQQDEADHGDFSCCFEIFPLFWFSLQVELQVEIFEI